MAEIIIGIIIGLVVAVATFFILKRMQPSQDQVNEQLTQLVDQKMRESIPEALKSANEQLVLMAEQKLGAQKNEIKTDVENKRGEIERLVKTIHEEIRANQVKLEASDKDRIGSFNALKNQLQEYEKVTEKLSISAEGLKKVLSNNQMRGKFGEQIADNLLKMAGFARGVDYDFNKEQEGSATRPDFTVFLPNKMRINVDSKFPYSNLQKMAETEDPIEKEQYRKAFERDVNEKIKQVSTRDYINPEDNTVDFAILFIPNEMIFSYIYDQMSELCQSALEKKIVLAGPFSFTAILRMVRQAYDNFRIQENILKISQHVKMFEKEYVKFADEFDKVGERIESLQKQYTVVHDTRARQLEKQMSKVLLESGEAEEIEEQKVLIP